MNASLLDELQTHLQGESLDAIARQLGVDDATAGNAVTAALPMMLGALGHNAQQPGGADALFGALQRDHSGAGATDLQGMLESLTGAAGAAGAASAGGAGGLGGLLGGLLGGGGNPQMDAGGILGHMFGRAQPKAEAGLGHATGLSGAQAGKLMMMLAPMVMAFLAKRTQAGNLDASGLGQALGQERSRVQQQGGIGGGLLDAVLDQDGDGKFDVSDLVSLGQRFFGAKH